MLANFWYIFKKFLKNFKAKLKKRIRFIFRASLAALGVYVLVFANYGFKDYWQLRGQKKELEHKLNELNTEKEELLKLVRAISGPQIDVDLLEMQVRKVLAYAREGEEVFFWK